MPEASREGSEVMQLLGAEHVRSALVSLAGFCEAAFKDLPCEQLADCAFHSFGKSFIDAECQSSAYNSAMGMPTSEHWTFCCVGCQI